MNKSTKLFSMLLLTLGFSIGNAHADLLGAGIGGLIGSQFGSGDGKIAMAAIGAVVGDRLTEPPRQAIAQDNYGYAPQVQTYGYQQNPGVNYYAPTYRYTPPVVVRAPMPMPIYYSNNYGYQNNRSWGRNEGHYGHRERRAYGRHDRY
jgi:hypothetical protein